MGFRTKRNGNLEIERTGNCEDFFGQLRLKLRCAFLCLVKFLLGGCRRKRLVVHMVIRTSTSWIPDIESEVSIPD